jgi:3-oxoacyl-(acyl-carrier-protein) synthase
VSGFLAVREALRLLADGKADRALVVGYDSPVEPQTVLYFAGIGLLAREAIRSFDAGRDGCLLGEGAAALVIETADAASRRGAEPRGEILGAGTATEAGGILAIGEEGEAVRRAIEECLAEAGLEPDRVSMVAAHGNGTVHSDASEGRALLEVFGPDGPPVTGFKWATGHLMGASAILEAVLALLSLEHGEAPGIATLRRLEPSLSGLQVSPSAQPIEGGTGVVVSRGYGGSAAALALRASRSG